MWFKKNIRLISLSDAELIARYQESGDQQYCSALFERYVELVYGVCLKYCKEPELSKDYTLDIYQELMKKLPKFEIKQFRSWLYVLTKNFVLQQIRKKSNGKSVPLDGAIMHSIQFDHLEYDKEVDIKEGMLNECLKHLPTKQKAVIEMFYYKGMSYEQIAGNMAVKKDKVRSFIQNGRRNLKICIEKKYAVKREDI